ncbi:MAG: hypothetical protein ACO1O6_11125 [Bacteroidota bacterium]
MSYANKFELSLQANKGSFVEECQALFSRVKDTSNRIILYDKLALYNPLRIDNDHFESVFEQFIHLANNPQIKNENLVFQLPGIVKSPWEIQEETNDQYLTILTSCMEQFWLEDNHERKYGELANFDLYEELITDEISFKKINKQRRGALLQVIPWMNYCEKLIETIFDDFTLTKTKDKGLFFKKIVKENVYFCFGYDEKFFKREVNYGKLITPEIKIFLLIDDESISEQKYIDLGLMENPFFRLSMKLDGYYATKKVTKMSNGTYFVKSDYEIEKFGDNEIRVYGDESFADQFKRFAYYYYSTQKVALKPYFDYIINSLI